MLKEKRERERERKRPALVREVGGGGGRWGAEEMHKSCLLCKETDRSIVSVVEMMAQ